jgi:SAM-dependent methyltransferase
MTGEFSTGWLALREPADAEARAGDLLDPLRSALTGRAELVIRDLGCGTGSLGRWLAPQLPAPQHWIMQDRDPALLAYAAAHLPAAAGVTVETRLGDVTALTAADLADTDLVTCSALLDILTAAEVEALAAACAGARCAALLTLSVLGEVSIEPADPLDADVTAAFNAHQRRAYSGRPLLGPGAAEAARRAFTAAGASVQVAASPWRLGRDRSALTAEWLTGWLDAAAEERPDLPINSYRQRRQASDLVVTVGHSDILAVFH